MSTITNTFNSIGSFMNRGIFTSAMQSTKRNFWRSYFVDRKSPVYVDMNDLIEVYEICPHLQIVINTRAEMLANGTLKLRKKTNKKIDIDTHQALDLMKNPNPLQSLREFIYEYGIYEGIYSNNFAYRNKMFSGASKTLWNLPPGLMKIVPTGKQYDQIDIKGLIDRFELYGTWAQYENNLQNKFTTDEVMYINSGISKSLFVAESRLIALHLPISNIIGALKTRNLFIYHGPKNLISGGSKDSDGGAIPLGTTEQKRVEESFNKTDYGIKDHQSHTVVSSATLKVDKMGYPTKDMMLFEEVVDDWKAICAAYKMDKDIFPFEGATFENKRQGEVSTYNGAIKTLSESFCNFLDRLLLAPGEDAEFYLDYSDLYCMQTDLLDGGKFKFYMAQAAAILFQNGSIDAEHMATMCEEEYTGTGVPLVLTTAKPLDPNGQENNPPN